MDKMILPAVKAVIVRERRILMVKRSDYITKAGGIWEFPGGSMIFGESVEQCAAREVREETALDVRFADVLYTDHFISEPNKHVLIITCRCLETHPGELSLSHEHTDYMWADLTDLRRMLYKSILDAVIKYDALQKAGLVEYRLYRGVDNPDGLRDARKVRETVFMSEQGFSYDTDDTDATAMHGVLYYCGAPIAAGRVFAMQDCYHIGRVSVLQPYRGLGFGRGIMHLLEQAAIRDGAGYVELSSQLHAVPFYQGLGYVPCGEQYYEEHCPHIDMRKILLNS